MKKFKLIIFLIASYTLSAWALPFPQNKSEFCARYGTLSKDKEILQELAAETTNLMSFKNQGGLFNGGVCWWHSRFQRNIFYLSIFRPDLKKLKTSAETKNLIHQIRLGLKQIIIPGYANFADFSRENQKLIQNELNNWQIYDGVILSRWIDGLIGKSKVNADVLRSHMEELYQYVYVQKKIAYEKLQIKGISSHAWLVVAMKKTSNGFDLGIIDSNNPFMSELYSYHSKDESFFVKGYGDFVPYLEFKREEERLIKVGKIFCGLENISDDFINSDYEHDLEEARD